MFRILLFILTLALSPLLASQGVAQGLATSSLVDSSSEEDTAEAAKPSLAVAALLEVLQDETARAELVKQLTATQSEEEATTEEEDPKTLAQTLAAATSGAVTGAMDQVDRLSTALLNLKGLTDVLSLDGVTPSDLIVLALTLAMTVVVYMLLRSVVERVVNSLSERNSDGWRDAIRVAALSTLMRFGAVALAWGAGYALAAFILPPESAVATPQALYLNAFAAFGIFRALLKAVLSPDADHQPSLSRLAPRAQEIIYRHLRLVGGLATQTGLFIVPLAQLWFGYSAARSVRVVLATLTLLALLRAIQMSAWAVRKSRGHRIGYETRSMTEAAVIKTAERVWAMLWPFLAVAYALNAWFVAVIRPFYFEQIVIGGTLVTLGGLACLALGLRVHELTSHRQSPLAARVARSIPYAGHKLATVVNFLGWAAALTLYASGILIVLDGWNALDVPRWLSRDAVQQAMWGLASTGLILMGAALVWVAISSWIDYQLNSNLIGPNASARKRTLLALFRSAFAIALITIATMVALSQLGVDIGPLLAGAGVVGLAVGFGSQKLVQDVITGVFIQIENAMNEGDVVGVASITGVVEKISIRSLRLRTLDGTAHVIPFSSVDVVSNLTRDFAYHIAEISAAYKEDVVEVKKAMEDAFDRVSEMFSVEILEPLEMHGVTELGDSAVVIRARIKTVAGSQWEVGRAYTELVKKVMDERGLEIPFPHRQLVLPPPVNDSIRRIAAE